MLQSFFSVLIIALLGWPCVHAKSAPKFEDSIAQRMLACAACHGNQGRAGPEGYYPRLAGKPAGYLYNQLLNFREGRRHYSLMTGLVEPLSDAYLMEIAQYFSKLNLPYPPPQAALAPQKVLDRGRLLVTQGDAPNKIPACSQCHGPALTGVSPNIPGLLGLSRDYLNAQLGGWQTKQRRAHAPDCMSQIAGRLTSLDVAAVSHWLASQPLPVNTRPLSALPTSAPQCTEHQLWKRAIARSAADTHCDIPGQPCAGSDLPGCLPRPSRQLHGLPHFTWRVTFCGRARHRYAFWHGVFQ